MKRRKLLAFVIASVMTMTTSMGIISASATVYDKDLIQTGNIIQGDTYITEGVELVDGEEDDNDTIVFKANSSSKSRITSKIQLEKVESNVTNTETIFTAEYAISVVSIAKKFGFMFGLSSSLGLPESKGSTFVYIDGENGYSVGISKNENGTMQTLQLSNTMNAVVGETLKFAVSVGSEGSLKVVVDETTVYDGEADVNPYGYLGFGQTETSEVTLSDVTVNALVNETPENCSYMETFDNGYVNVAFMTTKGSGKNMSIIDGKIVCEDASYFLLETVESYANCELLFDVIDMQREVEKDGVNYTRLINYDLNLTLGIDKTNKNKLRLCFTSLGGTNVTRGNYTQVALYKASQTTPFETHVLPLNYNIWNEEIVNGRTCNFKVRFVDGELSLYLKYDNEFGYTKMFDTTIDYVPLGQIQIYGSESVKGVEKFTSQRMHNITLDNVGVYNLDYKAKMRAVEFKKNNWDVPEDYVYVDPWDNSDLLG